MLRSTVCGLMAVLVLGCGFVAAQNAAAKSACFGVIDSSAVMPTDAKDPMNALLIGEIDRFKKLTQVDASLATAAAEIHPIVVVGKNQIVIGKPLSTYASGLTPPANSAAFGYLIGHGIGHLVQAKSVAGDLSKLDGPPAEIELQADLIAAYWACSRIEEQGEAEFKSPLWKMTRDQFIQAAAATVEHAFAGTPHGSADQRQRALRTGYFGAENQDFGDLEASFGKNSAAFIEWTETTASSIINQ